MSLPRFCFAVVALSFLAAFSVFAQEAVDLAQPSPSPSATKSEANAEETPATTAKEKTDKKSEKPAKSLEETMRPEEFKAAGLDKLSEDELEHLDAYLQGYRHSTEKKANEQAQAKAAEQIKKATEQAAAARPKVAQKFDSLVSRVDGNFEGLKGRTMIKLEDGTVWKQANAEDHYRPTVTDHPAAVVMHTTFGYKMRIEGMPEFYVDPVVRPQ